MHRSQPSDAYGRRCLLARRMVEKGVRLFVWSQAVVRANCSGTPTATSKKPSSPCESNGQACGRTPKRLKRLGLLDSTLVVWGGEFGRTALAEGRDPNAWDGITVYRLHRVDGGGRH